MADFSARLWQDLRGQQITEAAESRHAPDLLTEILERDGHEALGLSLKDLTIKVRGMVRRFAVPTWLRWEVWERDNFTCQYCGSRQFLVCDHIYPVSRGGHTEADNLQTLCRTCNSKKGHRVVL